MSLTHPEADTTSPKNSLSGLRERFHDDEINYLRLRGDVQGVNNQSSVWDTDYTLERYTESTDRVIGLLDGSISSREILDPEDPERSSEKPDAVLWLDKSARPVSWFVDAFWEQFARPGTEKPDYEFLNIDRVNWFVKQGHAVIDAERRLGPESFNIDDVPEEDIMRLRALFVEGDLDPQNWRDEVWQKPTRLDGKKLLIIDEVKNRGGTLSIATQLLKRAIPEATVSGDYFWKRPRYSISGTNASPEDLQIESVPLWYDADDSYGRGVGEISHSYWEHEYNENPTQENLKKKIGWLALSAPHFDPETYRVLEDRKAKQLKQDIAYLSYAVADGKVRRLPSRDRDIDDMVRIIESQGLTIAENKKYSEERTKKPRS